MGDGRLVTMEQIAQAAGVARSTVSKALRNDPKLSVKRCLQVQEIAKQLGYRPHPMVAALMAQIHGTRRRTDPHHIAWIDLWPAGAGAATVPFWNQLLAGARRRARELGFGIEVHRVAVESISPARLAQILAARTQWGLIIPPVPKSAMHFPIDLRSLAGVTIGTSLREPSLHRISTNHYQGAQLACDRLRQKGFKRIGIATSLQVNERLEGKWTAGFLSRQMLWPRPERVAPLLTESENSPEVADWIKRENPDAVLVAEPGFAAQIQSVGSRPGLRPPPLAWLVLEPGKTGIWGIDHLPARTGAAAVELVVGQIHRNERGIPAAPHTLLLDGVWVEQ